MKYYESRIPKSNPAITDPVWPSDPFWRSKKYSRALRAKVAHEWHHDPHKPSLHMIGKKYGVPVGALTAWCYAYPFGEREMPDRAYMQGAAGYSQAAIRERAEAMLQEYLKDLRAFQPSATPTWHMMGDPLPSRSALYQPRQPTIREKVTLPLVP